MLLWGDVLFVQFVLIWAFLLRRRVCDEENNEFKLASSITEEDLEAMVGVKVRCQVLNNCIQDMKSFDGDLDSDSDNDEHDDDE